mmetsp:Transcript_17560/g.49582  ORF Transcript_17560/g.49582 Transcript_17560/m.49582 type:complete len:211 (-) Transcript_17560:934-1566(-)
MCWNLRTYSSSPTSSRLSSRSRSTSSSCRPSPQRWISSTSSCSKPSPKRTASSTRPTCPAPAAATTTPSPHLTRPSLRLRRHLRKRPMSCSRSAASTTRASSPNAQSRWPSPALMGASWTATRPSNGSPASSAVRYSRCTIQLVRPVPFQTALHPRNLTMRQLCQDLWLPRSNSKHRMTQQQQQRKDNHQVAFPYSACYAVKTWNKSSWQ